jgi:hypothetical protein
MFFINYLKILLIYVDLVVINIFIIVLIIFYQYIRSFCINILLIFEVFIFLLGLFGMIFIGE